jgi:hypothetical protein
MRGIMEERHRVLRCRPHTMKGYFMMPPHSTAPLTAESIRFWSRVNFDGPLWNGTPCWEWTGTRSRGYGNIWWRGKVLRAHRAAYELLRGAIPSGLTIDHLCRNHSCVNPEHLEAVTHEANVLRGLSPSAIHARKTHCIHGHPFDEANTYRTAKGWRFCKTCQRARKAARKAARRKGEVLTCPTETQSKSIDYQIVA